MVEGESTIPDWKIVDFSWSRDGEDQRGGAAPLQWPGLQTDLHILRLHPARQALLVEGRQEDQTVQPQGQSHTHQAEHGWGSQKKG